MAFCPGIKSDLVFGECCLVLCELFGFVLVNGDDKEAFYWFMFGEMAINYDKGQLIGSID